MLRDVFIIFCFAVFVSLEPAGQVEISIAPMEKTEDIEKIYWEFYGIWNEKLKKEGIWIVGTDLSGTQVHSDCDLTGKLAIVIGSEGEGMSRLTREACDFLVKIPMIGEIESLNASVAAGLLLYEAVRQRNKGGQL